MIKYDPEHFGRHGFVRHAQKHDVTVINLDDLARRVPDFEAQGHAKRAGAAVEVDLTKAGIDKLLGGGRIPSAFKITVAAASEQARAKVQEAGGQVILPEESKE
jgi:large subunit ribosomal protein L15